MWLWSVEAQEPAQNVVDSGSPIKEMQAGCMTEVG